VSGAGRGGNALAGHGAGQGTAVRAMSGHRPPALAGVGQGTGPGVHGRGHDLPQHAPPAFAQAATSAGGW
jgi:hypothetical protein